MIDWVIICALVVVVYAIRTLSNTAITITEIRHRNDRPQPRSLAELFGGVHDEDDEEEA